MKPLLAALMVLAASAQAEPLPGADAVRIVLKEDDLDYIFTRVQLLA